MAAVTIPVFAKVRIGHFAEAQILEALGVDMIDESEGEQLTNLINYCSADRFKIIIVQLTDLIYLLFR